MHSFIWQRILYNCTRIHNHFCLSCLTPYWENTLDAICFWDCCMRQSQKPTYKMQDIIIIITVVIISLTAVAEGNVTGWMPFVLSKATLAVTHLCVISQLLAYCAIISFRFFQELKWSLMDLQFPNTCPHLPFFKRQALCLILSILPLPQWPLKCNQNSNKGVSATALSVLAGLLLTANGAFKKMAPTNTERSTNAPMPGAQVVNLRAWQTVFWQFHQCLLSSHERVTKGLNVTQDHIVAPETKTLKIQ